MVERRVVEGLAALDVIVRALGRDLAASWPGAAGLVGMLVEQGPRVGIVWAQRERVVAELRGQRAEERDPRRVGRYDAAITVLSRPPSAGRVAVVVAGWGDLQTLEIDASELHRLRGGAPA